MGDENRARRAIVVGGSGFVGAALARALARAGWIVTATARRHPERVPAAAGITTHLLDVRDRDAVVALVDRVRPDAVVDCVAVPDPKAQGSVIVDGARHVALAAVRRRARHLFLSTDHVFDGKRGSYTEEDPVSPVNAYGRAKATAEACVLRGGGDSLVVRTSLVCRLDPLDPRLGWVIEGLERGEEVHLFTDEFRCPIWLDDLVAALVELLSLPVGGVLHVAGAERLSRYEIGRLAARALGVPTGRLRPALAATAAEPRPLDASLSIDRARRLLRTRLRGFREGLG